MSRLEAHASFFRLSMEGKCKCLFTVFLGGKFLRLYSRLVNIKCTEILLDYEIEIDYSYNSIKRTVR